MTAPTAPSWLVPAVPGALSNARASNTTTDKILCQLHFTSPVSGAVPASIRLVGQRPVVAGTSMTTPNNIWDTGWVGNYATSPFPIGSTLLGPQAAITVNGRIYALVPTTGPFGAYANVIGTVVSAAVNGPNVGSWRFEAPIQVTVPNAVGDLKPVVDTCNPGALAYCVGRLYALGQTGIYSAAINPDGTLGAWSLGIATASGAGSTMVAWQRAGAGGGLAVAYAGGGSGATPINTFLIDLTGALAAGVTQTGLGVSRQYGAIYVDPNSFAYFIGGEDGAGAPQSTCFYHAIDLATGTISAGWSTGQALPAARSRFGFSYVYSPSAFWPNAAVIESAFMVVGGIQVAAGAAQTTVYTNTGSNVRGSVAGATYLNALPLATAGCCAALTGSEDTPIQPTPGAPYPGFNFSPASALGFESAVDASVAWSYLAVIGGSATNAVRVTSIGGSSVSGGGRGPWYSFTGSILTTALLGNSSVVTANADGSTDLTFVIGGKAVSGLGQAMGVSTLSDGDQLQLIAQVADGLSGDVATSQPALLTIGQPPTLSAIAPSGTITNGQPTASFGFNAGAGGGGQLSYQIQVKLGAAVVYDTGTRYDSLNSALLTIAPLLAPSTTYTLIVTATSRDTAMPGSAVSATSTTTFATSAFTVLGAPAGFTVTPSAPNANVALAWSAVGSAAFYRAYYRRTGSSVWLLYADNIAGTALTAMDHIALAASYDFAVATVSAVPAESALSSTQTATIPVGLYSAYLHVATQGPTFGIAFQVQGSPAISQHIDSVSLLGFSQGSPITRYGTGDYVSIDAAALLVDATAASLTALQAVRNQVRAGGTCFYRDALGGQVLVTFDAAQAVSVRPPWNRQVAAKLTEVADLIGPYVPAGSAQGYLTLVNGRKPPLATSERLV